jgi:hypothetical protein
VKTRDLIFLAALTMALVATAGLLVWRESGSGQPERQDHAPLLPGFGAHLDDVAAIDVGDTHLRKQGDGWVIAQKYDYPADAVRVAGLLSTLGNMSVIEEKTSDPARYGELGLGEPGLQTGAGTPIRLASADGRELAMVIIGRTAPSLGRVGGGTYVRIGGDARTWLVEGVIRAPKDALALADTDLFSLDEPKAIKSVTVQAGRTSFALSRARPDDAFTISGGDAHPDADKAAQLAGFLVGLNFQDVRPAGNDKAQRTLTFQRFDGAKYLLSVIEMDKQLWVRASEEGPAAKAFNDAHAAYAYRLPDYRLDSVKLTPDALSGVSHPAGGRK